jgi:3-dehydroquinate dehydratase / shikimate dehydrogenase
MKKKIGSMLFVPIADLYLLPLVPEEADGIELRLDLLPTLDVEAIKGLLINRTHPFLFTMRKSSQGGRFIGSEEEREALIEKYLELEPQFFDLEYDTRPAFIEKVTRSFTKTRFILSYHNFQETPRDLGVIYEEMAKVPVYGYKMAALAVSTNDALRLLLFGREHPQVSVISMGEKGEFARVLGPVCGNLIDYACLDADQKTAPGQLTVKELVDVYDYHKLNPSTHLYGLIGDPVSASKGHLYHNQIYQQSVYVKMNVKAEELSTFFPLVIEMGFRGLSVTMPLKEKVLPFLQSIDSKAKQIGAVNTILIKERGLSGYNTDGSGALDAIEKHVFVAGKKVVLIGAGGAARAIAFEAYQRGAHVLILNRTFQKARELAMEVGCQSGRLSEIPSEYDILINCTPDLLAIDSKKILPSALLMDVVYVPRETPLLQKAASLGCQVVYGDEMFFNQAAAQIELGFGD